MDFHGFSPWISTPKPWENLRMRRSSRSLGGGGAQRQGRGGSPGGAALGFFSWIGGGFLGFLGENDGKIMEKYEETDGK